MKIVAFVTIKLNSERLPNKNILPLGEHPLCWFQINTLLQVKSINSVYVYCSDEKIKQYIPAGAEFLKRDKCFDSSDARAREIYDSFVNKIDADIYIAGLTTAPFVSCATYDNALKNVINNGFDSAFAVKREQSFAWYKGQPLNYSLSDPPRTQDLEPVFVETSAFFIFRKNLWKEYKQRIGFNPYLVELNKIESIDIDTKEDYDYACLMFSKKD